MPGQRETSNSGREGVRRIEFIPIEWRVDLKLNEDSLKAITPRGAHTDDRPQCNCTFIAASGVEKLRGTLHETLYDVLYFTSPRSTVEPPSAL